MESNNELKHYGVKGMKWGVVNTTVYVKTRNKFGENYSDRYKKKMTKSATKVMKDNRKLYDAAAHYNKKKADKSSKKMNKDEQKMYIERAKEFSKHSESLSKKLTDIDSGKMKAGKDFITNYEYSFNVLLNLISPVDTVTRKVNIEYR